MTDDIMNLRSLLEKAPDADVLREMIGFAAETRLKQWYANECGTCTRKSLILFDASCG